MWLGIDPLWEKYAGMNPYNYCAGNPVGLVDVDGRDAVISGDLSDEALNQLQNSVGKDITLAKDNSGNLSYVRNIKEGKKLSKNANKVANIIDDHSVTVNIKAQSHYGFVSQSDNRSYEVVGGAFDGTIYSDGHVDTYQIVMPDLFNKLDDSKGGFMMHELTESYVAGKYSLENGRSIGNSVQEYDLYKMFHGDKWTTRQPELIYQRVNNDNNTCEYYILRTITINQGMELKERYEQKVFHSVPLQEYHK